ncbi:MAG: hypothetical protein RSA65_11255, partial [Clostridia bacterium]
MENSPTMRKVVRVTADGHTDAFPRGTVVSAVLDRLLPSERMSRVLCALRGGVCMELNEPVVEDCQLTPLT